MRGLDRGLDEQTQLLVAAAGGCPADVDGDLPAKPGGCAGR